MKKLRISISIILILALMIPTVNTAFAVDANAQNNRETFVQQDYQNGYYAGKDLNNLEENKFSLIEAKNVSGSPNQLRISFNYPASLAGDISKYLFACSEKRGENQQNDDCLYAQSCKAVDPVLINGKEYAFEFDVEFPSNLNSSGMVAISGDGLNSVINSNGKQLISNGNDGNGISYCYVPYSIGNLEEKDISAASGLLQEASSGNVNTSKSTAGNPLSSASGRSLSSVTDVPANIHVTSSMTKTSVNIAWDTVAGAASYSVEIDGGTVVNTTANNYTITGLTDNTTHSVRVCTNTGLATGDWSQPLTFSLVSGTISQNTVWNANRTYIVTNSITVNSGVTLEILSGSKIYFTNNNYKITVNGTLNVTGAANSEVLMSSSSDPDIGGTTAAYWSGITIGTSGKLEAEHLTLKYGNIVANGDLTLSNSTISNCNTYGISLNLTSVSDISVTNNNILATVSIKNNGYNTLSFQNNTLTNSSGYPVYVDMAGTQDTNALCSNIFSNNTVTGNLFNVISFGGSMTTDKVLLSDTEYHLASNLTVGSAASLTIQKGAKIYVTGSNSITVNGTLNIQGENNKTVLMTSVNDHDPASTQAKYWGGITVNASGAMNAAYLDLRYNKTTINGDLTLTNSTVSKGNSYGLSLNLTSVSDINIQNNNLLAAVSIKNNGYNSFTLQNNTITNSDGYPVFIDMSSTNNVNSICTTLFNQNTLTGSKYNVISISGTITATQTLPANTSYAVTSSLTVNNGATLTASAGTKFYVTSAFFNITVIGTFNMDGEQDNPILFTSIDDPSIGGAGKSYWNSITVGMTGVLNANYIDLEYGKIVANGNLNLTNSIISNCNSYAINFTLNPANTVNVSNNTINAGLYIKNNGYTSFNLQNNTISNSSGCPVYFGLDSTSNINTISSSIWENNTFTGSLYNLFSIEGTTVSDQTLTSGIDYYFSSNLIVRNGTLFTIEEGTNIYVSSSSGSITVSGTLNIEGTQQNGILMTAIGDPVSGGTNPRNWGGITVNSNATMNADYLTIRYGKFVLRGSSNITNSTISNCNTYGISLYLSSAISVNLTDNNIIAALYVQNNGYTSFVCEDNTITNSVGYPIYIDMSGTGDEDIYSYLSENNILTGNIRNIISIGGTISSNKTLSADADYYVVSDIVVNSGATFTIPAGVNVYITKGYKITVNGTLNINGSQTKGVLVTSSEDTDLGGAGNTYWGGIIVSATGTAHASYLTLKYGKIAAYGTLDLQNSQILKTNTYGISLYASETSNFNVKNNTILSTIYILNNGSNNLVVENNTITKEGGFPIYVDLGGSVFSSDFLVYLRSGNTLTGSMHNEISLGGIISQNTTIPYIEGVKYGVTSDITVLQNVTLTLEPGVVLLMGDSCEISVSGTLISNATEARKNVITYYKSTEYGGPGFEFIYYGITYDGVFIKETGYAEFNYTDMKYYGSNSSSPNCLGSMKATNSYFYCSGYNWIVKTAEKNVEFDNCVMENLFYCNIMININNSKCIVKNSTFKRLNGTNTNSAIDIQKTANIDQRFFEIKNNVFDMTVSGLGDYFPIQMDINQFDDTLFDKISENRTLINTTYTPLDVIAIYVAYADGKYLRNDKTLPAVFKNYLFMDDIFIGEGVTLNVDPGVTLVMHAKVDVYGTFNLNGTIDNRVTVIPYGNFNWPRLKYLYYWIAGNWTGIQIRPSGTVTAFCADVSICDFADQQINTAFTVQGRLNMIGSSIFFYNCGAGVSYEPYSTRGTFIEFDTDIMPEIHYNSFINAYGIDSYRIRLNRRDIAFKNKRASQMIIDVGDNYWGTPAGPSVDGSTLGFLITEGFNLDSSLLEKKNFGQPGVSSTTGNFSTTNTDLQVAAPGFTVDFIRSYNSRSEGSTSFGRGWTLNFESTATVYSYIDENNNPKETVSLTLPNGSSVSFDKENGVYTSKNCRHKLTKNEQNEYVLQTKDNFTYTYNSKGNLISVKDKNGNILTIQVDQNGKIQSITDMLGRKYVLEYNSSNQITKIKDFNNQTIQYVYYPGGSLEKVLDQSGKIIQSYEYSPQGLLTTIKNGAGEVQERITYNLGSNLGKTKVASHTDSYGKVIQYSYDTTNKVTTITDQNNKVTQDYYDENYLIIKHVDEDGKETVTEYHNTLGDVKSTTDRNGNKTEYTIDDNGNVTKVINPDSSYRETAYDSNNNITSVTDECGKKTYYFYDANNNAVKVVQPLDGTAEYTADSNQDNFAVTSYEYFTGEELQSLGYKGKGLLKKETDPNGVAINYEYDSNSFVKRKSVEGTGSVINYIYDGYGRCLKQTSAEGIVTQNDYDLRGNLLRETKDGNKVTRYVYDDANRLIQKVFPNEYDGSKDGLNNLIKNNVYADANCGERYTYNSSGKMISQTDNENQTMYLSYDIYGNIVSQKIPSGGEYLYEYDNLKRQTKISYKDNASAAPMLIEEDSYEVLENKNTVQTIKKYSDDQTFAATTKTFNYANKVIQNVAPDSTVQTITYYANGKVSSMAIGDYQEKYVYDGLNREIKKWVSAEKSGSTWQYIYSGKTYDKAGQVISESSSDSYVALDETPSDLITYTCTYSALGQKTSVSDNNGLLQTFEYDNDGKTTAEKRYTNSEENIVTEYSYTGEFMTQKSQYLRKGDLNANDFSDNTVQKLSETYTYDLNGNLTCFINTNGVDFTYAYDKLNRMSTKTAHIIDETGSIAYAITSYLYTWDGQILSEVDPNNNTTGYIYNNKGLLEKKINANGGVTSYYYDRADRIIETVTPKNFNSTLSLAQMARTEYAYDALDRIITQTQVYFKADGTQVSYVEKAQKYDSFGNVLKSLDASGYAAGTGTAVQDKIDTGYGTEYTYNLVARPLTVLDPVSKDRNLGFTAKYTYDALGRQLTQTDANGTATSCEYDALGNLLNTKVKETPAAQAKTISSATYDRANRMLTSTDGNGNTTTYTYNNFNQLKQVDYPSDDTIGAYTEYYQYDRLGKVKTVCDSLNKKTDYTYNTMSQVMMVVEGQIGGVVGDANTITTINKYDKAGNLRYVLDPNGNITEYTYDSMNRVTAEIASNKITAYTYDENSNLLTTTDWLGNTTENVYDSLNRIVAEKDAYGTAVATHVYNNDNLETSTFDALGYETTYLYDKNRRLLSKTDESGHITSQTYDNLGRIAAQTDGNGNTNEYTYDAFSNLTSVASPLEDNAAYTYDLNGNLLSVTDTAGSTKYYEYNCANLLTKEIDAGGKTVSGADVTYDPTKIEYTSYYPNGLPRVINDRNSNAKPGQIIGSGGSSGIHYSYDVHGRITSKTAVGNGRPYEISYGYDKNGNLTSVMDKTGTTQMTYDFLNRMTGKTVPHTATMNFYYDQTTGLTDGESSTIFTDNGNTTKKVYDKNGRLSKVVVNDETTQYTYNNDSSVAQVVYGNGTKEIYTYMPDGLLQTLQNKNADNSLIDSYSYTYDSAHNMLSKTDAKGLTSYTYDSLNRIKTVAEPGGNVISYEYNNGNISEKTETLNTVTKKTEYIYDVNNRNTQIQISTKDTTNSTTFSPKEKYTYLYDNCGNQLQETTAKYVGTQEQPGYVSNRYTYDMFNQMVKTIATDETGTDTTVENTYDGLGQRTIKKVNGVTSYSFYDQNNKVLLEYNAQGQNTARNVYGLNLINRTCGSESMYYLYNGHADVTAMTGASGEIKATYYYDAFGVIKESTGNVNNSINYAGYTYDAETGLYYLNSRMYNPKTARFMQEDTYNGNPADLLSLNIYTYCNNEPNKYYDPTGHWPDWNAVGGAIKGGFNSAKDFVGGAINSAGRFIGDTAHAVGSGISNAYHATVDTVSYIAGKTGEVINNTANKVVSAAKKTGEFIGNTAKKFTAAVKSTAQTVYQGAKSAARTAAAWVDEHKQEIVTAAVVVGTAAFVIGTGGLGSVCVPGLVLATTTGALIGGGTDIAAQMIANKSMDLGQIDWGHVAYSTVTTGAKAFVMTAGGGPLAMGVMSAVTGGVAEYYDQVKSGGDINWGQIGVRAFGEAVTGSILGNMGSSTASSLKQLAKSAGTVFAANAGVSFTENFAYNMMGGQDVVTAAKSAGKTAVVRATGDTLMYGFSQVARNICFVEGTMVLTASGLVAIQNIKAGDKVIAGNPETGETAVKEVVQTFVNETNELVHIKYGSEEIVTTPSHPFYVPQKGWTDAIRLKAGDQLQLVNGEYVTIESVQHEILESPVKVYNFEVQDFHTYYVGRTSVLVHNKCGDSRAVASEIGNGKQYSTLYEASTGSGTTRSAHRNAANREFYNAMSTDNTLKGTVDDFFGYDVMQHMRSGKSALKNPSLDWAWHHPADVPGVIRLIPKNQHQSSLLQDVLHPGPNGQGGFGLFK